MRRLKLQLLCIKKNYFRSSYLILLPFFFNKAFYHYNGKSFDKLVINSCLMLFFSSKDFLINKKFG